MFKKTATACAICMISLSSQAGLLDAAVAVMGAKNGAIMDQAEARMNQSREEAAYAVAQADRAYAANANPASNTNNSVYSTGYLKTLKCSSHSSKRSTK